jgi:large subunit ribosomal protein L1
MAKQGKKYIAALKQVDENKLYSVSEAVKLLQKVKFTKFDETVSVSFNLGIDTKLADQQIRGAMGLPNGTGKTVKILAVTTKVEDAKKAGADFVGGKDMIDKIKAENWLGYDVIVATPDMMPELSKLGKILGPKGLMPNPKTGTVNPDIAKAIGELKAGKVEYRADKEGNMSVIAGKTSFDAKKLDENVSAIISQILKVKPSSVKGIYLKNCVLTSTMAPGIKLKVEEAKDAK